MRAISGLAMQTIEHLTECIGSRVAGSDNEHEAADYLVGRLAELGCDPRVQRFRFRSWHSSGPGWLVLEGGGQEERIEGFVLPYTAGTPARGVRGRMVRAGRWALVRPQVTLERFHLVSDQGDVLAAVLALDKGPARPFPNPLPLLDTPAMVVDAAVGQRLLAADRAHKLLEGRVVCLEGETRPAWSANIVAGGGQPGPVVALVAHYDSVEGSVGANDNASGVAVLLRLVERIGRGGGGRPNVLFVLFGAEEPFLIGSRAYISAFSLDGQLSRVRACLNLDMLGLGETFAIRRPEGSLWARVAESVGDRSDEGIPICQTPSYPSSDNWSFHEAGIPSAQLTREGDGRYHTPGDVPSRLVARDLEDAEELAARLIEACWREIDA